MSNKVKERRDRYHHKRSMEEYISRNDGKRRERYEVVASSDLNPEEALIREELKQAIHKAKASLSAIDSKIVEMARYITEHYKKMSDVTVKSHYCKALKKLAPLLKAYL